MCSAHRAMGSSVCKSLDNRSSAIARLNTSMLSRRVLAAGRAETG